jgi:hypothetical protein
VDPYKPPPVIASAESPWPGTEMKLVIECKKVPANYKLGVNEFLDKDGNVCRWLLKDKK